jgi:type IV pilus assembly protein PilA
MKAIQKGFTLIELMIVVAIIGILAAIALPAYQDYTIKAQVSEGPQLSEGLKTAIAEYYAANGAWPAGMSDIGMSGNTVAGSYVGSITQTGGVITINYGNKANAKITNSTLMISGAVDTNGDIAWVCGAAATPSGFTIAGAAGGSVLPKYLPATCK